MQWRRFAHAQDLMSDNQRKASDVLLDLEQKVDNILKLISVYDLNSKLILKSINNITKILVQADQELLEQEQVNDDKPINISPHDTIKISETPILTQRSRDENTRDPKEVVDKKQGRQVPVEQRIVDNRGKDLFMAEVTISMDGQQVKKLKTSAVGKWQCHLQPGIYSVYISKTDPTTMKKIDCTQEINVSEKIKSLTLPTAIINRS